MAFPSSLGGSRVRLSFDFEGRRRIKDRAASIAALGCVIMAVIPLGSILFEATVRGFQALTPSFITLDTGNGGIGNAIQGTLILVALASAIAMPVGVLAGVYMSEYGHNRVGRGVRFFTEVMTQIPSIVVGIFAFSLLLELGVLGVVSPRLVFSTASGTVALATIMIPFVARTSDEALKMVPVSTREAALALGIPRYRVILRIVLASARGGLLTGALLAVARAGGETAPLIMTAFGSPYGFAGLDQPVESMPHTIYVYGLSPYLAENQAAWGASLVLVLMMLGISIASRLVLRSRFSSGGALP